MTRNELISQVKNELKLNNADSRLTNKLIWSVISKHLAWLIKRESEKFRIMRLDSIFQTAKCIDVEEAPAIDDCCGVKSRCKVMRTKEKLPKIYEDSDGILIKSVFTIDGSKDFAGIKITDYMRKLENPHSKYDKGSYYFYNNGYLYFPKSKVRKVMVKAYFADDVTASCGCDDVEVPCTSNLEFQANVPEYLLGELMNQVLLELSGVTLKIQEDEQIDKNENRKN